MNIQTFNGLPEGAHVRVIKSGTIYRLLSRRTLADGRDDSTFRQVRANSKGVVGLYGPAFVRLKPENIELVTVQS